MITERRYGFRFSGIEGGLLLGSILLASFLIFISGVYVGREVAGRKVVPPSQVVRVPVAPISDPLVARATPTSDPVTGRTASTSTPSVVWPPVPKERMTPSVPSIPRAEEVQQTEKEKPRLAQSPVPVPEMKGREMSSPSVNEEHSSPRAKSVGEPFTPKLPVAGALRTEKPAPPVASRGDDADKKPPSVTVAHVEKVETPARSRPLVPEVKRSGDGKRNEAKPGLTTAVSAKKAEKQSTGWRVQVGATNYQETAQDMVRELRELGYSPLVSKVQMNGETLYRVRIGKFSKQGEAVAAVGRFRREGRFSQAYLVSE